MSDDVWPPDQWRDLQAQRLKQHVMRARETGLYARSGLPAEFEGLSGKTVEAWIRRLPLTTKGQLAEAGSAAWGVGPEKVAEWVCTSGTLGKPLDVPLTRGDLERLAENEAAALGTAGVRRGDLVLLAVGMERLFVAGLAYWLGAQEIGATCVRVGPQLGIQASMLGEMMERFGAGVGERRAFVIAVPSFLLGVDASRVAGRLSGIIAIGEPVRSAANVREYNVLGGRLQEMFGCRVMSTYALTETCATFAEGPECCGGHLNPLMAILECLDEDGMQVGEGVVGELVVTPLGVEGMPLVRFRTGDMAAVYYGACACGRTTPRVGPIVGRRGQLLKFKGTSIYPGAIVETLRAHRAVADCCVVATAEHALSDVLTVFVEARGEAGTGERAEIEGVLRGLLRAVPEVKWVSGEELRGLQGGSRKMARFIDRR